MGYRFLIIIGLGTALFGALTPMAGQASPVTSPVPPASIAALSNALKVACGWDYPCPPDPAYRLRDTYWGRHRPQEQVYIHNNYGSVTIQVDGHEKAAVAVVPAAPAASWPAPCGPAPCGEGWPPPCGSAPCIEEKPKEDCGVRCWWRRVRAGYCGHGCWSYREQARLEAEEKEEQAEQKQEKKAEREAEKEARREGWDYPPEYWRHYYDPPPPPAWERPWHRYPAPRYEAPKIDERTPMGRYEGPKYP